MYDSAGICFRKGQGMTAQKGHVDKLNVYLLTAATLYLLL